MILMGSEITRGLPFRGWRSLFQSRFTALDLPTGPRPSTPMPLCRQLTRNATKARRGQSKDGTQGRHQRSRCSDLIDNSRRSNSTSRSTINYR
jgi:hypothetical protein